MFVKVKNVFWITLFVPSLAWAVWTEPGCDPIVDGPECATIVAPLNVSSVDQTKGGGIYANFFDASSLRNNDGALSITNSSGDITVKAASVLKIQSLTSIGVPVNIQALAITGNTPGNLSEITNSGTGAGLRINPSASGEGLRIEGATILASLFVNNSGGAAFSATSLLGIQSTTTDYAAVFGQSTNFSGVVGTSTNGYGVFGNASNSSVYGTVGCFGTSSFSNCAYLGGSLYSFFTAGLAHIEGNNLEITNTVFPGGGSPEDYHRGITLYAAASASGDIGIPWCVRVNSIGTLYTTSGKCPSP